MKVFLNIFIAIVIITLVSFKILGIGFFNEDFHVDCISTYNIETNENIVICTVEDPNNLISDDYPLTIELIDSSTTIVNEVNLVAGENTTTFDELSFNSQYTIELSGYEFIDDTYISKIYYTHIFSTIDHDFVLPNITKSDLLIGDTSISFLISVTDTQNVINSISITISDNGAIVDNITLTDLSTLAIAFDSLEELTEYHIEVDVTYQINDFDTLTSVLHNFTFDTLETPDRPSASISIVSNDNATLIFNITTSDLDATETTYIVELIDENDTIIYSETLVSNTVSIDISSIVLDYRIVVFSNYSLDGHSYTDIELKTYNITTNENSNFFSIPTLNIVDITVPLGDYDDYDDYLYTHINEGDSEFRIECTAPVDCTDLVNSEIYSDIPFEIIGMVHSYFDTKNIGYVFTPNYIDITITYVYSPSEIALITAEMNNIINSVTTITMTTDQKILAVHDYIVNNSVYDQECYNTPTTCDNDHNAYGILFDANGVCEGYAHAMDIALRAMRIPSVRISSDTHQWNGVYLDGSWLHLDATWDDPISSGGGDILSHDYFLINSAALEILDTSDSHTYNHTYISFIE